MATYTDLRSQCRSLEHQTDQLLHKFSVDAGFSQVLEQQLSDVIAHRQEVLEDMRQASSSERDSGTKALHVERHQQTLQDHIREFRRIQGSIAEAKDREQLLSSMRESASNRAAASHDFSMTQERANIDESHSLTDSLLARAYATRESFVTQRATLMRVQNTISQAAQKIPGLNVVLKKIDSRKKRDTAILACLISTCILILFFWS